MEIAIGGSGDDDINGNEVGNRLRGFSKPVFLLGGVGPAEREQAWAAGAQGVAGIRAFWPQV